VRRSLAFGGANSCCSAHFVSYQIPFMSLLKTNGIPRAGAPRCCRCRRPLRGDCQMGKGSGTDASFEPIEEGVRSGLEKRSLSLRYRRRRVSRWQSWCGGICAGSRGGRADDQAAALRRADDRWHALFNGCMRNGTARKNAHGHAANVYPCLAGKGCTCDGQRLSGERDATRWAITTLGLTVGVVLTKDKSEQRRKLMGRHHLWHGQGVRLRFSSRPPASAADGRDKAGLFGEITARPSIGREQPGSAGAFACR